MPYTLFLHNFYKQEAMMLSIVIVNWNTVGYLEQCLKAVFDELDALAPEVIVVDNASQDGSARMVRETFPQARLMENQENVGFARANNQAIDASRGQAVLLLNSDAFISPGAIQKMLAVLESQPKVGIVGANLVYPDGSWQWSHGPLPSLFSEIRSLAGLDKVDHRVRRGASQHEFIETGTVSGACLLARREMLQEIGPLDESFFMFNEEVDLCLRANEAGWKVVHVPSAQVVHLNGGSTGVTPGRILMLYQGKRQYFAKHQGQAAAKLFFLAARLAVWAKWLAYGRKTQKAALWRSVLSGMGSV